MTAGKNGAMRKSPAIAKCEVPPRTRSAATPGLFDVARHRDVPVAAPNLCHRRREKGADRARNLHFPKNSTCAQTQQCADVVKQVHKEKYADDLDQAGERLQQSSFIQGPAGCGANKYG